MKCLVACIVMLQARQHDCCLPLLLTPGQQHSVPACPSCHRLRPGASRCQPATAIVPEAASSKQPQSSSNCAVASWHHLHTALISRVSVSAFGCFAAVLCAGAPVTIRQQPMSHSHCGCLLQHGVPWMASRRHRHGEAACPKNCLAGPPAADTQASPLMFSLSVYLEALSPHLVDCIACEAHPAADIQGSACL